MQWHGNAPAVPAHQQSLSWTAALGCDTCRQHGVKTVQAVRVSRESKEREPLTQPMAVPASSNLHTFKWAAVSRNTLFLGLQLLEFDLGNSQQFCYVKGQQSLRTSDLLVQSLKVCTCMSPPAHHCRSRMCSPPYFQRKPFTAATGPLVTQRFLRRRAGVWLCTSGARRMCVPALWWQQMGCAQHSGPHCCPTTRGRGKSRGCKNTCWPSVLAKKHGT
jgi:hypothetical protein